MEKFVLVDCEGSASTQDHACTKWVFTLMYLYITYGTKFSGAHAVDMKWHFDILKQRENVALFLCIDILLTFPTCTKSFTMCLVNSSTKLPQRLLYLSSEGIYEGYCQLNVCGKQIWARGRDTALMRATILQRSCSRCPVELAHCDIDVH